MGDNYLRHFGILGMKWGIRRYQNEDGTLTPAGKSRYLSDRQVSQMAKKDARRNADAKMYYGEGAGNRRKLLKAELDSKMKDSRYSEAFNTEMSKMDYSRSAKKAVRERNFNDSVKKGKRIAKVALRVSGGFGFLAATTYYTNHKSEVDGFVNGVLSKVFKK